MKIVSKTGLMLMAGFAALAFAACTDSSHYLRHETARRLASPAWMIERQIQANSFRLAAFERMHEHNAPADIYIEGEGNLYRNDGRPSRGPTPKNPVALHLATRDLAENVAYLGRPCQFISEQQRESCDPAYWTDRRFSQEVIAAYSAALDDIKRQYDIKGFNLVGVSGGGTIALLLAAQRPDVMCVRTVSGNLDHKIQSVNTGMPVSQDSLNPPDFAEALRGVPQYHFLGGQDETITPAVLHSYLQAVGPAPHIQYEMIQEATHETGWVEKWPELLARSEAVCTGRVAVPVQEETYEVPGYLAPIPEPLGAARPEKP